MASLRHAQNWSLATMNTNGITPRNENIPLTIDAQYVVGFDWQRTPQFRIAKDFADKEIAPGARERDRGEIFPKDVLRKMAPLGLLGGPVPEKYGGIGLDFVSHALVTEEVGRADSSVRTTLSVQISLVEMTILKAASGSSVRK